MGFSVLEVGWYVHGREDDGESAGVTESMTSGLRKRMWSTETGGAIAKTRIIVEGREACKLPQETESREYRFPRQFRRMPEGWEGTRAQSLF